MANTCPKTKEKIILFYIKNVSKPKIYVQKVEVCGIKRNLLTGLIDEHDEDKIFMIERKLCEYDNKYEFVEKGPVTGWKNDEE